MEISSTTSENPSLPGNALEEIGLNRLEQVVLTMPEARFYFTGDREQSGTGLRAWMGDQSLTFQSLTPFADTGEGICYFIALDVSASIPSASFQEITAGLGTFCETLRPQDRVIFLTFGDTVNLLFDESGEALQSGSRSGTIRGLTNPDQHTLLFEAVNRMAELSKGIQDQTRRVSFVITDGDDISTGAATQNEALQTLREAGIPVYGFTLDSAKRASINAFGEFCRTSGGRLELLAPGEETAGFQTVRQELLDCYEAVFQADSNRVSNTMTDVTLELTAQGELRQMQAMQSAWIPDTVSPAILSVTQEGPRQLRVTFSERVEGLESVDHFRITEAETGTEQIPAFSSMSEDGTTVMLTFSADLPGGDWTLTCQEIQDSSMEQNALEGTAAISIEGTPAPPEEGPGFFSSYGWLISLGAVLILAVAIVLSWRRFRARKAVVMVEDRAILKSNTQKKYHVSLEQAPPEPQGRLKQPTPQDLPEQTVYIHVEGQDEEIPVSIQSSLIVGRSSTCDLSFNDPALSRQHFVLELRDGQLLITGLSRTGGTFVNNTQLGDSPAPLRPGDRIRAGRVTMTLRW